jgi:hypothetical protein
MLSVRFVYADTSVWNRLCDENADPHTLSSELARRNAALVIGFNVLSEIAKLFVTGTEEDVERGRKLMDYMKEYMALQVPILKENWSLLIEEAMHVTGDKRMESCFRDSDQHRLAIREIEKLCAGDITPEASQFFESRKFAARASRTIMKEQLADRPDVVKAFGNLSNDGLPNFLRAESLMPLGQSLLLGHLRREFPKNSPSDLCGVVELLLQRPGCRVSHAMTRADLYLIWRCAKRGSLRGDLPDDTFHAVNAAYSHVFLTTEADQASIARHAIEGIKAFVFGQTEVTSDRLLRDLDETACAA